jgi:hypothetical protein
MKTVFHKSLVAMLVMSMLIVSVMLAPNEAEAKWHDHSDELPGMDFNATPYFIAGGVIVGGLIIYMIASHHSKDKADTVKTSDSTATKQATPSGEGEGNSGSQTPKQSELIPAPKQSSQLGVFFNVTDDNTHAGVMKSRSDLSDLTLRAGIKLGF